MRSLLLVCYCAGIWGFALPARRRACFCQHSGCHAARWTGVKANEVQRRRRSDGMAPLLISLDDNWEDLSNAVSTTVKKDLHAITESLNSLNWENPFSPEWFATVRQSVQDLWQWYLDLPVAAEVGIVLTPIILAGLTALYWLSFPPDDYRFGKEPYVRGNYDPLAAKVYYKRHPYLVLQRCLQILRLSNRFLIKVVLEKYVFRTEEQNRPQRALELLTLVSRLGPTAIKVGQALSVRPDLIAPEYTTVLATLQDRVPPFDGSAAKEILRRELGEAKFRQLTNLQLDRDPVASASIGQVYKGAATQNGESVDVAVKIQRPGGLAEIALDLFIVREFAPYYQKITQTSTDLQGLANEWGRGFIAELDYLKEADSTTRFTVAMQARGLTAVCAPLVLDDYTTEQVLVTKWVDGTRLDQSDAADVPRLCSVALNAYLVMLLELQSLHCDPHPGNLLRTPDGRLCILDFGMTLDIDPNLQYSLLEFVAHLTANDYNELPEDLARLDFLKRDKLDFARRSGVLEPLKFFLQQAGQGGGAKGVRNRIFTEYRAKFPGLSDDELRVKMRSEMKQQMAAVVERESVATGVTVEVEELQRRYRDSFQIPEWFLYTSRAFLTLEGVSLQADENYSIIKSCFPYVAKRLVADNDPRARKALRDLLYGTSGTVDVDRLTDLADGFSSYTATAKTTNHPRDSGGLALANGLVSGNGRQSLQSKLDEADATLTLVKDSADILLAKDGNLVQNLLVEESALAASARFKDQMRDLLVVGPRRLRETLPFGNVLPPLPLEDQLEPFLELSVAEQKAKNLAERVFGVMLAQQQRGRGAGGTIAAGANDNKPATAVVTDQAMVMALQELEPEQAALVLRELRTNLPKYAPLAQQLSRKFLATLLETASGNLEQTLQELQAQGINDGVVSSVAGNVSRAYRRGAQVLQNNIDSADRAR